MIFVFLFCLAELEDNFENHKKDTQMRLTHLEDLVADLQNRAQQDSSASDVDQDDDNSRDSPDEDANDPDSDEDDYQSEGGGGDESDDDDDENGSNNEEEEDEDDYDQDSDGGNSRRSYESSSSVEYASDASSYRGYTEYQREDNSDDGSSNGTMSVEELNDASSTGGISVEELNPDSPPVASRSASSSRPAAAGQTRNAPNSTPGMSVSQIGRDFTGWVLNTSRGTITPYLEVPRSTASTQQPNHQVSVHTALNSANTRLPPPPPYRPTSTSTASSSSPSVSVVSVSSVPASAPTRPSVVSVVSTSPGVSVVPTSPPEIKMQVSFQVISRGQTSGTSTVTRANSGGAPLIPIQLYSPISNTGSTPTTCTQVRTNRLSIATVTSTQSASNNIRSITNTAQGLPIPLRRGLSQADARAVLRPLATGSGSVIASRIPGTRRRRVVPSRLLSFVNPASSRERSRESRSSSSSRHRSQSGGQRNSSSSSSSATTTAAPTNLSATASAPSSSSHTSTSSHQVSSSSSSTARAGGGGSPLDRSSQSHNTPSTSVNRPNPAREIPNSTPTPAAAASSSARIGSSSSRRRIPSVVVVPSGSRLRSSGEVGSSSGILNRTPTDQLIRYVNMDVSISKEIFLKGYTQILLI